MTAFSQRAMDHAKAGRDLMAGARVQWERDHPGMGAELATWDELYEYLNAEQAAICRSALCWGCGLDVNDLNETYMVREDVWAQAAPYEALLCVGCLEDRLGRRLKPYDFTAVPLNTMAALMGSDRLRSRLKGAKQ